MFPVNWCLFLRTCDLVVCPELSWLAVLCPVDRHWVVDIKAAEGSSTLFASPDGEQRPGAVWGRPSPPALFDIARRVGFNRSSCPRSRGLARFRGIRPTRALIQRGACGTPGSWYALPRAAASTLDEVPRSYCLPCTCWCCLARPLLSSPL